MPHFTTSDGVRLHYESVGAGRPLVFVHEFAGDARSFEDQVRFFARRYHCVSYNARGYPPSDVPVEPGAYSQDRARDDLLEMLDHLGQGPAHVVGVSMGGFAALHAAMARPEAVSAIVAAGSGYGAYPPTRDRFRTDIARVADEFASAGTEAAGRRYAGGPSRRQLARKDPLGQSRFLAQFLEHPAESAAATLRAVQRDRPSLWDLAEPLAAVDTPALIVTGDEDEGCLEPALFLKRTLPAAGLLVLPNSGHAVNLEEPAAFNSAVLDFLHLVEAGAWPRRV